jgi:hypothetical protein
MALTCCCRAVCVAHPGLCASAVLLDHACCTDDPFTPPLPLQAGKVRSQQAWAANVLALGNIAKQVHLDTREALLERKSQAQREEAQVRRGVRSREVAARPRAMELG